MPSPTRDNRSATTFWLDDELKKDLKKQARILNTTITELINRAIQVYLDKGLIQQDIEKGQIGMTQDIKGELDARMAVDKKMQEMEQGIKGLSARIESLETKLAALNFNEETVRAWIKMYVTTSIQPVMVSLSNAIQRLDKEDKSA